MHGQRVELIHFQLGQESSTMSQGHGLGHGLEEDYIEESEREKLWDAYHLSQHLKSAFHCRDNEILREQKALAATRGGQFICPYLNEIKPAGAAISCKVFEGWSELGRHTEKSQADYLEGSTRHKGMNEAETAPRHDALKETMGWYEPTVRGDEGSLLKEVPWRRTMINFSMMTNTSVSK